jgi:disulfide bond formation protein DsbB
MEQAMNPYRPVLLAVALVSMILLAVALYLQHVMNMLPCPLCVLQRYAFAAVAIICLIAAGRRSLGAQRTGTGLAAVAALTGLGIAGYHLWIKANPTISCGIDPLETSLNTIPTARLLPFLFQADGLCTTEYEPILGLSIPQWSFIWFAIFAIALGWTAWRRVARG